MYVRIDTVSASQRAAVRCDRRSSGDDATGGCPARRTGGRRRETIWRMAMAEGRGQRGDEGATGETTSRPWRRWIDAMRSGAWIGASSYGMYHSKQTQASGGAADHRRRIYLHTKYLPTYGRWQMLADGGSDLLVNAFECLTSETQRDHGKSTDY
jgi:hypothetical protein